jgi:hypothetical protein
MSHKDKDSDASASSSSSASEASDKKHKSKHKEKKVDKKKDKKKSKKPDKKDKKDKKKSSKRGPRGAQWLSWKIPYQESSILGQSFQLASKKGGVDLKKLEKQIKGWKGTPAFILRKLKKGHSKGFKWDVDDSHGRLRITGCKLVDKKWTK